MAQLNINDLEGNQDVPPKSNQIKSAKDSTIKEAKCEGRGWMHNDIDIYPYININGRHNAPAVHTLTTHWVILEPPTRTSSRGPISH